MNPALKQLHPYPFQKLAADKQGIVPDPQYHAIDLSIGEPKQEAPAFILQAMAADLSQLGRYPLTAGTLALREAIASWLTGRYKLAGNTIDPHRHVIPVSGTREALFGFAQATIDRNRNPLVVMPNPFYQIYEGAALLAGAEPYYVNATEDNAYLPDFDAVPDSVWRRCQVLYLCNPYNPTGAVFSLGQLQSLLEKAHEYDFYIASDECYSEIYDQTPPAGLLQAAYSGGDDSFQRCMVFHSLSKRSNLPGLRSGFVAGDAEIIKAFLHYRTYQGCALPLPTQAASIVAWQDEQHVEVNRDMYRQRFRAVIEILQPLLNVVAPPAGFYLWPRVPMDDTAFAKRLFQHYNVTLLPGSYLSRNAAGINPGKHHLRMALVASLNNCVEAAERIRSLLTNE